MSDALVRQAQDIRAQAAALLVRAETLLREMRQMPDLISAAPKEAEKIKHAHGSRVIQQFH